MKLNIVEIEKKKIEMLMIVLQILNKLNFNNQVYHFEKKCKFMQEIFIFFENKDFILNELRISS